MDADSPAHDEIRDIDELVRRPGRPLVVRRSAPEHRRRYAARDIQQFVREARAYVVDRLRRCRATGDKLDKHTRTLAEICGCEFGMLPQVQREGDAASSLNRPRAPGRKNAKDRRRGLSPSLDAARAAGASAFAELADAVTDAAPVRSHRRQRQFTETSS